MSIPGFYSSIPWQQRLLSERTNAEISKSGESVKHAISSQTKDIIASNESLTQTFGDGFNKINNTLQFGLSNIYNSIEDLRYDFNYGMGLIMNQLQIQNDLLKDITNKLDSINNILENPILTQAREFYRIGCERLSKGLLDKALESFLRSREKNDSDFFTEYQIGMLYLYGIDEDDNVINPQKAEEHLSYAYRYGNAEISQVPEIRPTLAEVALHASIACYAWATNLQDIDKKEEAIQKLKKGIQWAKKSLENSPSLLESNYHLAKYSALLGEDQTAISNLELIIRKDRKYCLKIDVDLDFDPIRPQVINLFKLLREEVRQKAENEYQEIQKYFTEWSYFGKEGEKAKDKISALIQRAKNLIEQSTYFDYLDFIKSNFLKKVKNIIDEVSSYRKKRLKFSEVSNTFLIQTIEDSLDCFNSISISPNASVMAIGCKHDSIKLWKFSDGQLLQNVKGYTKLLLPPDVNTVNFNPDGNMLVAGYNNGAIWIWQLYNKSHLINKTKKMFSDLNYKSNEIVFDFDSTMFAYKCNDNSVNIIRISDSHLIRTISDSNIIHTIGLSPDGTILAIGFVDKIILLKIIDGKIINTIYPSPSSSKIKRIAFNFEGTLLAALTSDGTISLYWVSNGFLICELKGYSFSNLSSIRFSDDGNLIVTEITNNKVNVKKIELSKGGLSIIQGCLPSSKYELMKSEMKMCSEKFQKKRENQQLKNKEERERKLKNNLCLICNNSLGFFDKMFKRTSHKSCLNAVSIEQ